MSGMLVAVAVAQSLALTTGLSAKAKCPPVSKCFHSEHRSSNGRWLIYR